MAFRVVLIENEVGICVKLNNLVVSKGGEDTWIPLDDISMVVVDNLATTVTIRMLCQLAETGIGMIICNQQHLPIGFYCSYDNHSRASKIIGLQIEKDKSLYDLLWKEIVESKIHNQANAYFLLKSDENGRDTIEQFSMDIKEGDRTNREAHAAKVYFNLLMGTSFSRGNEEILLNSGLDYGYAIVRGYIARLCVGYGLNTQIGIHHKNEYNRFNLVDDLIEPIRPFVDIVAYKTLDGEKYFKPEHRYKIIGILDKRIRYRNKKMYFSNMLDEYVSQVAGFYQDHQKVIVYPNVNDFMMGDEGDEI